MKKTKPMKLLFYKLLVFFIGLTSTIAYGQKYQVYQKTYDSDAGSTLYLNVEDTTFGIGLSNDNKIYINYNCL